jgi:hypothetical protein
LHHDLALHCLQLLWLSACRSLPPQQKLIARRFGRRRGSVGSDGRRLAAQRNLTCNAGGVLLSKDGTWELPSSWSKIIDTQAHSWKQALQPGAAVANVGPPRPHTRSEDEGKRRLLAFGE